MFNNLKVGVRLGIAFAITIGFLCMIAVLGINGMSGIMDNFHTVVDENNVKIASANNMRGSLNIVARATRNVLLYPDAQNVAKQQDRIAEARKHYDEVSEKMKGLVKSEVAKKLMADIEAAKTEARPLFNKVIELSKAGKAKEAAEFLRDVVQGPQDKWFAGLQAMVDLQEKQNTNTVAASFQDAASAKRFIYIAWAVALLLSVISAWWITLSITRPLTKFGEVLGAVADGDLSIHSDLQTKDELGAMSGQLNATITNLREAMLQVQESAMAISQASGEISMGNQDLSRRTEEQAASLEETASSLEQITSNVNQTADNSRSANQESSKARQVAQDGGTAVTQVIAAMEAINQSSAKINEIIGVVDEIAFQTNLLALNAAVEAARAGEQGRGFAVVAAEVRNLAKRSADAAKEIKGLIRESVAKSTDGNKVAAHAGETIQQVVTNVQRVTSLVSDIANATQEQSTGLNEINKAVVSMDEVTQQNAALVEEAAAAAESLDSQAHALNEIVSRFKTGVEVRRTAAPKARTTVTSQPAARPNGNTARAALKRPPARPELAHAKAPVATPKSGDDGQWEAF